jgi:hypothetical protein
MEQRSVSTISLPILKRALCRWALIIWRGEGDEANEMGNLP